MVPSFSYKASVYSMTVVVLSYNRMDELQLNIPDLIKYCIELNYELIIVDNASKMEVRSYLKNTIPNIENVMLLQNEANLGVAGGRNKAYAKAKGEYILSIDDDTKVSFENLKILPDLMRQKYKGVGILAIRVIHSKTHEEQNYFGEKELCVSNHHGAACVIRRKVLSMIGGIDEYCNFGSEEIDLCIRAHSAGFEIRYTPEIIVYHNNIPYQGIGFDDRVKKRVFNNARTMHKYFPFLMASQCANRYLGRMLLIYFKKNKYLFLINLLFSSLCGRVVGLYYHEYTPNNTVKYYNNKNLVPEFGNKPFYRTVIITMIYKYKK